MLVIWGWGGPYQGGVEQRHAVRDPLACYGWVLLVLSLGNCTCTCVRRKVVQESHVKQLLLTRARKTQSSEPLPLGPYESESLRASTRLQLRYFGIIFQLLQIVGSTQPGGTKVPEGPPPSTGRCHKPLDNKRESCHRTQKR